MTDTERHEQEARDLMFRQWLQNVIYWMLHEDNGDEG